MPTSEIIQLQETTSLLLTQERKREREGELLLFHKTPA